MYGNSARSSEIIFGRESRPKDSKHDSNSTSSHVEISSTDPSTDPSPKMATGRTESAARNTNKEPGRSVREIGWQETPAVLLSRRMKNMLIAVCRRAKSRRKRKRRGPVSRQPVPEKYRPQTVFFLFFFFFAVARPLEVGPTWEFFFDLFRWFS